MTPLLLILTGGTFLVLGVVLFRVWPALRGRVSIETPLSTRLYRWNTYVSLHIQKYAESKVLVASAASFTSGVSGVELSMSTWSMHPTVMTHVDFIAIADPGGTDKAAEVLGFVKSEELRTLLGGIPEGPTILGHRVWTYVWPERFDLTEITKRLISVESFREMHGLDRSQADKGE